MGTGTEILSLMDLLDLDEEMVDKRLETIMHRRNYTKEHLANALHLLKYKNLINLREESECGNNDEFTFVVKLIESVLDENVDIVCEILSHVLCLNISTIVSNSEHLLQQLLSDTNVLTKNSDQRIDYHIEDEKTTKLLINFKLCNSILDSVLKNQRSLSLHFIDIPLETILSSHEKVQLYFLNNIVPKLFEAVIGYNILDKIWDYIKQSEHNNRETSLKILCSLSEFFLPVPDSKGIKKFESQIIYYSEFWYIIKNSIKSNDPSVRKLSIYLMKRAIDCLNTIKKDFKIYNDKERLFNWNESGKQMWDNFFILIDSLEEKQSNIVLPSLKLFDSLNHSPISNWLDSAYNIGLQHDNTQVRLKSIEYKLQTKISSVSEAKVLLEALNDSNLFDQETDIQTIKTRLITSFRNIENNFVLVLRAIPEVKWSPVPLYHLSCILREINWETQLSKLEPTEFVLIIQGLLEVSCNNVPIREAVKINVSYLMKVIDKLQWKELLSIYSTIKWDLYSLESKDNNPLILRIKNFKVDNEKCSFFNTIFESHTNIDFALLYLENHKEDVQYLLNTLNGIVEHIHKIVSRQYSDKTECLKDVITVAYLIRKCMERNGDCEQTIKVRLAREIKTILQYILGLLSDDSKLTIEEIATITSTLKPIIVDVDVKEILLQLYKSSIVLLNDIDTNLDKKVFAVFILNMLKDNVLMLRSYKHEMLNEQQVIELANGIKFKESSDVTDNGRYRNVIYEKICEVLNSLLNHENVKRNLNKIENFIVNMTECGGYGCLKWILRIMNKVLPVLIEENTDFNVGKFFARMWKEIDELKSNNQYSPCIKEFVHLLLKESLLKKSMYNNIVIQYSSQIIEYAPLKNMPLYYLVKDLHEMNINEEHGHIVCILCDILLYSPVPKKDQRIADNVAVEIFQNPVYGLEMTIDYNFNFHLQFLAISTLFKIKHKDILQTMFTFISKNAEEVLGNKQRYHGNSQIHRTLLIALQHRLMFYLLDNDVCKTNDVLFWSIALLGRLPHQPSVRICLEWFIALHIYLRKTTINQDLVDKLRSYNVPITSQFTILYWVLKRKIVKSDYMKEEFEFTMDTLLSHTMGQMFNIRLNAQYLATKLYEMNKIDKYNYIIDVIQNTFIESSKDKNFIKMKEDFFVNDFDIVKHLVPSFVYYFLPRYCGIGCNEIVDQKFIINMNKASLDNKSSRREHSGAIPPYRENDDDWFFEDRLYGISTKNSHFSSLDAMSPQITEPRNKRGKMVFIRLKQELDFSKEWKLDHEVDENIFKYKLNRVSDENNLENSSEALGTIQKKYVPWKNMSDIDVYDCGKKKESPSELIVVASLIDKLPNLGGMARTSEVFGVHTYVVNSLRHLQDKQFQGLSVSAERWVNIEEVRPGAPLMRYLTQKSNEGYSIIAAEQTSTSCQLQNFKFPKKTVLLLGHEKEGIPCDLLPLMDHCVEIPQQGFVRSLNVHVTAAIFIWEYSRQNILK